MRKMTIGTMVRQKLYTTHHEEQIVYRYGLVIKEFENLPTKGNEKYYKVLWQPSDAYAVSRNRSYMETICAEKLELVSEVNTNSSSKVEDVPCRKAT